MQHKNNVNYILKIHAKNLLIKLLMYSCCNEIMWARYTFSYKIHEYEFRNSFGSKVKGWRRRRREGERDIPIPYNGNGSTRLHYYECNLACKFLDKEKFVNCMEEGNVGELKKVGYVFRDIIILNFHKIYLHCVE